MSGSTLGTIFTLTTFGESHGKAMGGVIEGFPAEITLDLALVQQELNKRRPGQSELVSARNEKDQVEFLSGIFEGKSTGTPIGFIILNENQESKDYSHIKNTYRPSHADFTFDKKYGIRDYRGGGRASARETVCRVVAGALAKQALNVIGIKFSTYVTQIGEVKIESQEFFKSEAIEKSLVRCPIKEASNKMEGLISEVKKEGDTLGGIIQCIVKNVPAGLGEPVFDKLHASLGKSMLSINAVKGFEIGSGFESASMKGSDHNDVFDTKETTISNFSGGVQGGISNGMPIVFRVAFKPVATIMKSQDSIDKNGNKVRIEGKGRHDACVVPRAVPIVESMAAITLLDYYLRNKTIHI
ncbi:chorismate synthase [Crocinitomicaceae bacterium]|jgi:chorismate synthase|nr:chorismate synthase [Crocinitomicaceae bacterium]MDC3309188.1 chorismate synthase [Crocinitomicaceae bacterium]